MKLYWRKYKKYHLFEFKRKRYFFLYICAEPHRTKGQEKRQIETLLFRFPTITGDYETATGTS